MSTWIDGKYWVAIVGGAIDGTPIGATTPAAGVFTTLQTGNHVGIGVAPSGNIALRVTSVFTSDGAANFVAGMDLDPTITMAPGDTSYAAYLNVVGFGITTQVSETVGHVTAAHISDPQIVKGAGATVTIASTLWIDGVPTEGTLNAAIYMTAGNIYHAGQGRILLATPGSAIGVGTDNPGTSFDVVQSANTNLSGYRVTNSGGGRALYSWVDGSDVAHIDSGATADGTLALNAGGSGGVTTGGAMTVAGAFGCNTKAAQTAYASGGALAAYGTGLFGFDSEAHASALYAMVVSIRAALVANGVMS